LNPEGPPSFHFYANSVPFPGFAHLGPFLFGTIGLIARGSDGVPSTNQGSVMVYAGLIGGFFFVITVVMQKE
jgi:hypothetical protein